MSYEYKIKIIDADAHRLIMILLKNIKLFFTLTFIF